MAVWIPEGRKLLKSSYSFWKLWTTLCNLKLGLSICKSGIVERLVAVLKLAQNWDLVCVCALSAAIRRPGRSCRTESLLNWFLNPCTCKKILVVEDIQSDFWLNILLKKIITSTISVGAYVCMRTRQYSLYSGKSGLDNGYSYAHHVMDGIQAAEDSNYFSFVPCVQSLPYAFYTERQQNIRLDAMQLSPNPAFTLEKLKEGK